MVSNHGGRQLDGSVPALQALVGVVAEVKGKISVLFDSGIRGGADLYKALALAVAGQQAVFEVIENSLPQPGRGAQLWT